MGIHSIGDPMMTPNSTPLTDPLGPILASRIPALEYHYTEFKMGPTIQMKTEWFLAQMQWLSDNGFKTLTSDDIIHFIQGDSRPSQKSCLLRFDLGQPALQNYQEVIIPTLEKYSFHAVFFLLTNMIKDTCAGANFWSGRKPGLSSLAPMAYTTRTIKSSVWRRADGTPRRASA
jgi:hypothetical protein